MGITPFGGNTVSYPQSASAAPASIYSIGQRPTLAQSNGQDAQKQREQKLQSIRDESYRHIMSHEQAHASAAGSLGGGIHIDYDANGIAVAGHVPIMVPGVNPNNPELSLSQARQVYSAATAPGGDMSAADSGVASRAMSVMGQAQVLMGQKARQKQFEKNFNSY